MYKRNEIINIFYWQETNSCQELRQPGFMYSDCGPFTKKQKTHTKKKKYKNLKKKEIQNIFIKTN